MNATRSYRCILDVTDPAVTEEHYHSLGVVFLSILPIKWLEVIHYSATQTSRQNKTLAANVSANH